MCRINGIFSKHISSELVIKMRDTLSYGGPDDSGIFIDDECNIGLGHRRLSILDLSPAGHQPMHWNDLVIVYNGEVYNYKEVAEKLKKEGYSFSTGSDTEVILKAFECWGHTCVQHFRGMFAFAIWNKKTKKLTLCRDRVGVKPLYWYQKDGLFMFASELKAFQQHPDFDKTINQDAVSLFLQTGYIKSPYCIFQYAHKLLPGSFLEIDAHHQIKIWRYWDVREVYQNATISQKTEQEQIEECEHILTDSFQLRMVADVPVGMFLSGGVDSSLTTALLQKNTTSPLKTFAIGFEQKEYNETHYAKAVAQHLGTDHTELICTEKDFKDIIPQLPHFYDEPFGDSSAIPTHLVSKLARQSVTVSLSADAGDEIFGGYNRYLYAETLFSKLQYFPSWFKNIGSNIISSLDVKTAVKIAAMLPISTASKKSIDVRLPKLAEVLKTKSKIDFLYASTIFITPKALAKIHLFKTDVSIFDKNITLKENLDYAAFGMADIESYLEGDILTKVDRATMQVALEGREPFLDHKIIEFAMGLPDNMKIRDGQTKWILRQILYKYVPKELIEREKMGFGIPLDNWLSTFVREDLVSLTEDKSFFETFLLDSTNTIKVIKLYLNNQYSSPTFIWYLYVLHQWYKKWM
jgi:asparagine synthase (glutamine-hydrolysing)